MKDTANEGLTVMFLKVIALLIAAVLGYYMLGIDPDQAFIYFMLPASAVAVIWLLAASG